jgi:diguanylate cyclase (GGDEF)-like protein
VSANSNWSTQQLAEFLTGISTCETEEVATELAIERAAEALEAEVAFYIRNGEIVQSIGFPAGSITDDPLSALVDGDANSIDVPGIGETPALVVPVVGELGGHIVVARVGNSFEAGEASLVRAMGRALSLTVGGLKTLAAERERRELLAKLSRIQRSISHHAPLQEVLDAISEGASELLGEPIAGLTLLDPENPGQLVTRSMVGLEPAAQEHVRRIPLSIGSPSMAIERDEVVVIDDYQTAQGTHPYMVKTGLQASIAAPVREAGKVVGALTVGSRTKGRRFSSAEREALTAFADHASLALTDARLTSQVDRALHDQLTGLPNRSFLIDRIGERVDADADAAVIAFDLDHFRGINDRIGHGAGDRLLVELSRRLRDELGPEALTTRLEGDTFAVLTSQAEAEDLARRTLELVARPFEVDGRELRTSASIGLVLTASDPDEFLHSADLAMNRAKRNGGARVVVYESSMHSELMTRLKLQDDLARALEREEIQAHFQPKVDFRTAKVIGVEALVRWAHPERGLVGPADFLELAEAGGHMRALTERVIEYSTRAAGDWWRSGLGLQLSVNLSASTFSERDWRIDEFVARTLAQTGLPGNALQFEITEDALMGDSDEAAAALRRLSDLGAGISIDDFGTGYSSLGRLRDLPIDELKIDRSFIMNLVEDEGDMTIVRSTIHLAHQMGLQVVAEGVETQEAWRQLRKMGCERAQGFLIAKPMPAREIPAWIAAWSQRSREFRDPSRARRGPAKPKALAKPAAATA